MKPFVWQEGMSTEETKNGAYWERNMLALLLAIQINRHAAFKMNELPCGWYVHGEYEGWARVISIYNGSIAFHVPDDFDLGLELKEIQPNWDGHTTFAKWELVMEMCECIGLTAGLQID